METVPRELIVPRPRGTFVLVPRDDGAPMPLTGLPPRASDPAAAALPPRVVPLVLALPRTTPPRGNIAKFLNLQSWIMLMIEAAQSRSKWRRRARDAESKPERDGKNVIVEIDARAEQEFKTFAIDSHRTSQS
jgi:hypothetical protein